MFVRSSRVLCYTTSHVRSYCASILCYASSGGLVTISAAKLTLIRFTSGQKPVHLHVLLSHPISYQYRLSPIIYQLLLCGSTPCRFTQMAAHPSLPHHQRELMLSY
ncbi:hypothetical protein GBAR_LOCUS24093, partial [Geodia barretti]